jgi:hypothetical protein
VIATLVHPAITVPPAVVIAAALWWYWLRIGHVGAQHASRRRIRRVSTLVMLLSLPLFVHSLSILDPATHPRRFVLQWSVLALLMLIIILSAAVDAINSLRLHREEMRREMIEAANELAKTIRKQREVTSRDREGAEP